MTKPKRADERDSYECLFNIRGGGDRFQAHESLDQNIAAANRLLKNQGLTPLIHAAYQSFEIVCESEHDTADPDTGLSDASIISEESFGDATDTAHIYFPHGFRVVSCQKIFTYTVDETQLDVLNPKKEVQDIIRP